MSNRAAYVLSATLVLAALIHGLCGRYELHTAGDGFLRLDRLSGQVIYNGNGRTVRVSVTPHN